MDGSLLDRARGCAVGAAIGDALGMPLEFGPPRPPDRLVREMRAGRLPAGAFTDDTEMALALADSLLASRAGAGDAPFDADDLAARFAAWYAAGPPDVGGHTAAVLARVRRGVPWHEAAAAAQAASPDSAGNGSVMRCWPVALARWDDHNALLADSRQQSEVTHGHPECVAACALVNAAIYALLRGDPAADAVSSALALARAPAGLRQAVENAPGRRREQLANSGWVRHTVESAVWALLTTSSFEEAVIQAANLGGDADTSAAVTGALAGAAYGLDGIPKDWRMALRGEWPLQSGVPWDADRFIDLADRLVGHQA